MLISKWISLVSRICHFFYINLFCADRCEKLALCSESYRQAGSISFAACGVKNLYEHGRKMGSRKVFLCYMALLLSNQQCYTNSYESKLYQSALRQVHRLFQTKYFTQCYLLLLRANPFILDSP